MSRDLVIALGFVAVAVTAPALALAHGQQPATATVTAVDAGDDEHMWTPADTAIAVGGSVTFRYPSGSSAHNVAFDDSAKPSACAQTAGPGAGPVPPLPAEPSPSGWQGACRFDTAGVYTFFCQAHPGMRGTIRVGDPAAPLPASTPGATATPTPAQTQTTLERAVTIARSQKGARVRGSVDVKVAGSRLEVRVSARLTGGRRAKPVRVGQLTRTSTPAGKVSFAVGVAAKARKALRRRGRLPVTVGIALTPPGGRKLTRSATSTLRVG